MGVACSPHGRTTCVLHFSRRTCMEGNRLAYMYNTAVVLGGCKLDSAGSGQGLLACFLNVYSVQPPSRARIPDAVFVQLFLLKMGMARPETRRG